MWRSNKFNTHQQGVTLVELVIAIVIISIASVALLQGLGFQTGRNVDPMIQSQAQALAKQYLQEVLSKSFFNTGADPRVDPTLTQTQINTGITDQTRNGSPARVAWDNIYEYHNYSSAIVDVMTGAAVSELSSYQVSITVDISAGLTLHTFTNSSVVNCPPQIALVTVNITDPRNQITSLAGYRTSYWDSGC